MKGFNPLSCTSATSAFSPREGQLTPKASEPAPPDVGGIRSSANIESASPTAASAGSVEATAALVRVMAAPDGFARAKAWLPCVRMAVAEAVVAGELLFTTHPVAVSKPMTASGGVGLICEMEIWPNPAEVRISAKARLLDAVAAHRM